MDLTTLCVLILVAFVKNHTRARVPGLWSLGPSSSNPETPRRRCQRNRLFENLAQVRYENQSPPAVRIAVGGITNPKWMRVR